MAVPKLRFKEFDGDWKSDKVGKFLIEYKQKVPSSTDIEIYSSSRNGLKPQKEYFDNRELQNFGEYGVVPPNYLTYRHMSDDTTFKFNINLIGKKIAVSKEYPVFTTNEFMDSSFLLFKLNESNDFKKFAIEQKKGGTRTRLYFKALCTWKTLLPTKEEQTKIASFLSAVDEKISQLSQKHQLLSQYKQGMMQKLFSQQIRFKADDGSEFEEWEITTLGLTGKFIGGGTPSKKVTEFWQGSIPWISSSDLVDESIFNINITRFISTEALNQSATKLIPANSILIVSRVGVGKVAVTDKDICTSQDFTNLVLNNGNTVFFGYLIKSLTGRLLEMNQGTSIKGFVKDDLSTLKVQIPCLEEQLKIANLLSSIDQKIDIVLGQLEQAKQWKKGLLQQMFV
ncbi:restriction endonuclease subunit S [Acinetobacter schindleri]|uniref:restriction endonuclease subunit S n=2 Tax=Acinetobacter TaxID=469 RepID=UPI00281255C9|nr:restriction endonuclease subunit S [Acinetobacter schindleri]